MLNKEHIAGWLKELQDTICRALEATDGAGKFAEDSWERKEGGGGRTRIMENGAILEKGGVNFSAVHGPIPDFLQQESQHAVINNKTKASTFYATGVSIVLHPHSPMVPIIHMNVRYFEMDNGVHWFGGGIDLTPHYVDPEDARYFHQELKSCCDQHHQDYYPAFKKWADDYFYISHRQETRGIGGIFFDRLSSNEKFSREQRFAFLQSVGNAFAPVYTTLMKKNHRLPFSEKEKNWQLLRRGRYVEFNLVYDKGTKFGLETNGRVESILMSLPTLAGWQYNFTPEKGSKEEQTLALLKKGINWTQ